MHILTYFKDQRRLSLEQLKQQTKLSENILKQQLQQQIKRRRLVKRKEDYILKPAFKIGFVDLKEHFGFFLQEEKDLYIDHKDFNTSLDGDLVLLRQGAHNKVLEVLKRNTKTVVCQVKKVAKRYLLIPKKPIRLPIELNSQHNFIDGDLIYIELIKFHNHFIEAKLIEKIGHITDPDIDILNIVYQYDFPYNFSEQTLLEAENISSKINLDSREIINDEYIITIDGADAKDLDDAISLKVKDNKYYLSVHIADVSYYVKEHSSIDKEAYKRATSAYLADRVIPMLPRKLSNDLCSLSENEYKYALSVFITLDEKAKVINHQVKETIIKVNKRLSYEQVNEMFAGKKLKDENLQLMLEKMLTLSELLTEQRYKRGALNFISEEYLYILDNNNQIKDIVLRQSGLSEKIIESFMILTNEIVGEHLSVLTLPNIYRIHPKPTIEKLNQLFSELSEYNIIGPKHKNITAKTLQLILKEVSDSPLKYLVNEMMLKSMNKAKYSMNNEGHFGLASRFYSHFTAPIRRYPDLLLHRLVKDYLIYPKDLNKKIKYYENKIPLIAEHSSKMEKLAETVEREVDKYKIAEFMETKINESFEGIITGFINSGFFVKINKGIEGFVPFRLQPNLHYDINLGVVADKTILKMGSEVTVKLVEANKELRQITFILKTQEQ